MTLGVMCEIFPSTFELMFFLKNEVFLCCFDGYSYAEKKLS